MWAKYNPNPAGLLVGDCTVRAICAVTGRDWYSVHDELCDLARRMADMPSADRVWWTLLKRYGFRQREPINTCPDCYTVADFAAEHQYGTFVLGTREHAVAVVDGVYYDAWDSGGAIPEYFIAEG